jgi:hypothetical protein
MTNFVRLRITTFYVAAAIVVVTLGLVAALGVSVAKALVPTSRRPSCACRPPHLTGLQIAALNEGAMTGQVRFC